MKCISKLTPRHHGNTYDILDAMTRPAISGALSAKPFSPESLLKALELVHDYAAAFQQPNSQKHPISLRDHTYMVCMGFEDLGLQVPAPFQESTFRLMLALHDIGKPDAWQNGHKHWQHSITDQMIQVHSSELPVSGAQLSLIRSLVRGDYLGLFLRGRSSLDTTNAALIELSQQMRVTHRQALAAVTTFYQVDAISYSAYTVKRYFPHHLDSFSLKPKLEGVFAWSASGRPQVAPDRSRLVFSPRYEYLYSRLLP